MLGPILQPVLRPVLSPSLTRAGVPVSRRMNMTNLAGLARWGAARDAAAGSDYAVVTCLGDSITWGVGSDGTAAETFPLDLAQQATYRGNSWPAQLRQKLCARISTTAAENFIGLRPNWGFPFTTSGTGTSGSTGPFGQYSTAGRGGLSVPAGASVTLDAATMGEWTTIDVYYWGSDSGVSSSCAPSVSIDGVAQTVPTGTQTGKLNVLTFTVAAGTHSVVLSGTQSGLTAYVWAVNTRNGSNGVVVNRIAAPGAKALDLAGTSTGNTRDRVLRSSIMPGITDLLILSLGTNDQGAQVAIADYTSQLQEVIDMQVAGGGCVLLLGEPPAPSPTGTLTEDDYRNAMKQLALNNQHVAYGDMRDVFGTFATAYAKGLEPTSSTVHPSQKGASVMANVLTNLLTLPSYA